MSYTVLEKRALPRSEFFLALEIPARDVETHLQGVLEEFKKEMELPGFRKGFVPEKIIRERVGEMALWEEAATKALSLTLRDILVAEKLDAIGHPRVEATLLAPKNPAKFKVTLSLFPDLILPEYKKIAAEHNRKKLEAQMVEEKEIDTVIAEIQKQYKDEKPAGARTGEAEPAITDETVKKLGNFSSVADFRDKVRQGLVARKEEMATERKRAALLDALTEKSKGDIPDVFIENELSRMEGELRAQLERMGSSFENYMKEIKKDVGSLRNSWRANAEKRVRLELALRKIASLESVTASEKEINAEVAHLMEHHKGLDIENVRSYVETILTNKKVIEFLEHQSPSA